MLDNNQIRNILHWIDISFSYDSSKISNFKYEFLANWFEAIDDPKKYELIKNELIQIYTNFLDSINQLQKYSIYLDYYNNTIVKCEKIRSVLSKSNERLNYKYIIDNILPIVFNGCRLDSRYFFANLNNIYELYQKKENHRAGIEQAFYFTQSFYLILLTFYFNNLYDAIRNTKVKSNQRICFHIEDFISFIKNNKISDKQIDLHEKIYNNLRKFTQLKLSYFEKFLQFYNIFKFENYDKSYIIQNPYCN